MNSESRWCLVEMLEEVVCICVCVCVCGFVSVTLCGVCVMCLPVCVCV